MRKTTTTNAGQTEIDILARILGHDQGQLPPNVARYILKLGFSDEDRARMHDLAARNQEDALLPGEKEEMFAYAKAGSLLGILKSGARRVLRNEPKKRTTA